MAAWCESSSQLQRKRPASNTYHPHPSTKRVAWSHLLFRGEHWLNEGLEYQRKSHTTDAPGAWEGLLSVISSNFWWRNAKRSILTETGRKGRIRGQDRGVRERSPRRWTGHWGVLLLWGHTLVPLYWPLSCWELGEGQCLALGAGRGAWPADTEQPVHRGWEWCGLGAAKWHLSLPRWDRTSLISAMVQTCTALPPLTEAVLQNCSIKWSRNKRMDLLVG